MGKVKIELNLAGVNEMMKSPEIGAALEEAGAAVARAAGAEYEASVHEASFVAICNVWPNTKEAGRDNRRNNTLLKAVGTVGLPTSKPRL